MENSNINQKTGVVIGYIFSYAIFTTILFYILKLTKKLPSNWSIFQIIGITLIIVIIGLILKKLLK